MSLSHLLRFRSGTRNSFENLRVAALVSNYLQIFLSLRMTDLAAFNPSCCVQALHLPYLRRSISPSNTLLLGTGLTPAKTIMESKKLCRSSLFQALVPLVAAILVAEGFRGAAAMTGACSGSLSSMSICLPAVEGDNPPMPTDACCAIIRSTDTGCLCNIVTAYSNSMGVNLHASLLLPKQCKKAIPPGYTCDGYMVPSYVPPAANRKLVSV